MKHRLGGKTVDVAELERVLGEATKELPDDLADVLAYTFIKARDTDDKDWWLRLVEALQQAYTWALEAEQQELVSYSASDTRRQSLAGTYR